MPDIWMDVDTALSEVPVNILPLIDDTDFKSRETDIAYNQSGMDLVWNFVTTAGAFTQTAVTPTSGGEYDWSHQGDGMYTIEIPASGGASINNDTEGFGWFTGLCDGVLPWRGPVIGFRASGLNDLLIDSAYSTTRGLAGTALPAAAADAAGGLPISDAGGLDMDAILADTNELQTDDVPGLIAALNDLSAAEVKAQVDAAIETYHLDHLLAVDYDPASKPGVATALLNELVENDGGVSRFTANALEEAPTGGSAPTVEEIRSEMDSNSTQLAAIVADTNELQTDDVPGLIAALNDISAQDVTDDLLAEVIESSKTFKTMLLDIWAVIVGNASANDADNPTTITYDSPDDTVQRTHTLTSTSRTVS